MANHLEHPQRFNLMKAWLEKPPYEGIEWIESEPAINEDILRVHSSEMLLSLRIACSMGLHEIDPAPTFVTGDSFDAAFAAAGGVLTLSRRIRNRSTKKGEATRGFAIVRPPGHHADSDESMGFCLFNNTAIAVADALTKGLKKIAIIDFDAHHGNGTESIFWDEPRVGYFSLHQERIYPGSGFLDEARHAKGRIINLPLTLNSGDTVFVDVCEKILDPWLAKFHPEMLFVSAGFDGHFSDPLTSLGFSTQGYYQFAKELAALADKYCDGRLLFIVEGGYAPLALSENIQAVLCALTEGDSYPNSFGNCSYKTVDIDERIQKICSLHDLKMPLTFSR